MSPPERKILNARSGGTLHEPPELEPRKLIDVRTVPSQEHRSILGTALKNNPHYAHKIIKEASGMTFGELAKTGSEILLFVSSIRQEFPEICVRTCFGYIELPYFETKEDLEIILTAL